MACSETQGRSLNTTCPSGRDGGLEGIRSIRTGSCGGGSSVSRNQAASASDQEYRCASRSARTLTSSRNENGRRTTFFGGVPFGPYQSEGDGRPLRMEVTGGRGNVTLSFRHETWAPRSLTYPSPGRTRSLRKIV